MLSSRIGHWSWALSADERKTAALVAIRWGQQAPLSVKLRRKHEAMFEKQRKLEELGKRLERDA
jgi:hypothetical protein